MIKIRAPSVSTNTALIQCIEKKGAKKPRYIKVEQEQRKCHKIPNESAFFALRSKKNHNA